MTARTRAAGLPRRALPAVIAAAALALVAAPPASARYVFAGAFGAGEAGRHVAVDRILGSVYTNGIGASGLSARFNAAGFRRYRWITHGGSGIAVEPGSRAVYVVERSGDRIRKFEGTRELASWRVEDPVGVAFDPRNRLVYVLSSGDDTFVRVYTPDGFHLEQLDWRADFQTDARAIAVDPRNGDVYAVNGNGREYTIRRYAPDGRFITSWQRLGDDDTPVFVRGIGVDPFGIVVLADFPAGLARYSPSGAPGEVLRLSEIPGLPGVAPYDVGFGPDGDMYVVAQQRGSADGIVLRFELQPDEPSTTTVADPAGSDRPQASDPATAVLPDTGLVAAPPRATNETTVSFQLVTRGGERFGCQLRRAGKHRTRRERRVAHWHPCPGRKTFRGLRPGRYVFVGRSFDARGRSDATPLKVRFTVDRRAPRTRITGGSHGRHARFRLRSAARGARFECRLLRRGAAASGWRRCPARMAFKRLRPGRYVLQARAIDRAGNRDRSPATRAFRVAR